MKAVYKPQVTAGYTLGALVALVTWALVRFVPAFRHGLPPDLATLLPALLGVIAHSVGTALAPEASKIDDVLAVVTRAENAAAVVTQAASSILGAAPKPRPQIANEPLPRAGYPPYVPGGPAASTAPPLADTVAPLHEQLHEVGDTPEGKPIMHA